MIKMQLSLEKMEKMLIDAHNKMISVKYNILEDTEISKEISILDSKGACNIIQELIVLLHEDVTNAKENAKEILGKTSKVDKSIFIGWNTLKESYNISIIADSRVKAPDAEVSEVLLEVANSFMEVRKEGLN